MSPNLRYSEDELREQWAFIDSLVDSQASALRSGAQDPEEEPVAAAPDAGLLHELDALRERIRLLEAERALLLERVRVAEAIGASAAASPPREEPAPLQPAQPPRPQPRPASHRVEAAVRGWWRRISR